MDNSQNQDPNLNSSQPNKFEGLLWILLLFLILLLGFVLVQRNWQLISSALGIKGPINFDEAMSSNEAHNVTLDDGRAYDLSYETSSKRIFSGLIRHTSPIIEPSFAILTFDILVTSGDYSNSDLVQTSVSNHHFTWMAPTTSNPQGTINLLHTVPINEEVNKQLKSIQNGNSVIITGYDIYRIDGYDSNGNYIGYWEDSGCNTTLITNVEIISK